MKLKQIADMAMAMFYQDYRPQDAFFDASHFKFLCIATYNKLINDEFKIAKLRNKLTDGFSFVEISPSWLIKEMVPVKKDDKSGVHYAEPQHRIFTFGFDNMSNGVQYVGPVKAKCNGDLIRISYKDKWQICRSPVTKDNYFYQAINRVELVGGNCLPDELEMWYISQPSSDDDNSEMADEQVMAVITTVLTAMFGAKNGETIDMTNNANSNRIPGSETDLNSIPQQ